MNIRFHHGGGCTVESERKRGGIVLRRKNSVAMRVVAWILTSVGSVVTDPVGVIQPRMPL